MHSWTHNIYSSISSHPFSRRGWKEVGWYYADKLTRHWQLKPWETPYTTASLSRKISYASEEPADAGKISWQAIFLYKITKNDPGRASLLWYTIILCPISHSNGHLILIIYTWHSWLNNIPDTTSYFPFSNNSVPLRHRDNLLPAWLLSRSYETAFLLKVARFSIKKKKKKKGH